MKDEEKKKLESFWSMCSYVRGSYDKIEDYRRLSEHLEYLTGKQPANRFFYLALPPSVFKVATTNIKETVMTEL